ncbi:MAG: hypothetical protein QF507_00005, partial [Vicinamibacterales bacterium]|nr:hypothetical protein [Vicinamibacterales bacterium]
PTTTTSPEEVSPTVEVDDEDLVLGTGKEYLVEASGFEPGSQVEILVESNPVSLGFWYADYLGRVAARPQIPITIQPGYHHLVVREWIHPDLSGRATPREARIPVTVIIEGLTFEYLEAPTLTGIELVSTPEVKRGGTVEVEATFAADSYSGNVSRLELIEFSCIANCGPGGEQYFRGYADTGWILFAGETRTSTFTVDIPNNAKNGTYTFEVFTSLTSLDSDVSNRCEIRLGSGSIAEYDESSIDSCSVTATPELISNITFTVLGDDLLPPILTAPTLTGLTVTSGDQVARGGSLTVDADFEMTAFTGDIGRLELIEFSCIANCGEVGEQYFRGYADTGWNAGSGETRTSTFTVDIPNNAKNGTYTFEVFTSQSWTDPVSEISNRCEIRLGSGSIAEYDESSETSCISPTAEVDPRTIEFTVVP